MRAINTRCYLAGCGAGHTEPHRKGSASSHSIFTPCGISPSPDFRSLGSDPSSSFPAACSAFQCLPSLVPVICSGHTAPCTLFLIYLISTLWCACRWGHFSGTNLGITCTREWVTPLPWTPHWARCIHRRRSRITSCCPPSPPPMRWSWLSTSCWSLLSCCISSAASWLWTGARFLPSIGFRHPRVDRSHHHWCCVCHPHPIFIIDDLSLRTISSPPGPLCIRSLASRSSFCSPAQSFKYYLLIKI